MIKRIITAAFSLSLLTTPGSANAGSGIIIHNPNLVQYGITANKVYLRNLNQFDSSWLGCCYNYWFDLSTDTGKAHFSTFLSYKAMGKAIHLFRASFSTQGEIEMVGEFL